MVPAHQQVPPPFPRLLSCLLFPNLQGPPGLQGQRATGGREHGPLPSLGKLVVWRDELIWEEEREVPPTSLPDLWPYIQKWIPGPVSPGPDPDFLHI